MQIPVARMKSSWGRPTSVVIFGAPIMIRLGRAALAGPERPRALALSLSCARSFRSRAPPPAFALVVVFKRPSRASLKSAGLVSNSVANENENEEGNASGRALGACAREAPRALRNGVRVRRPNPIERRGAARRGGRVLRMKNSEQKEIEINGSFLGPAAGGKRREARPLFVFRLTK